MDFIVDGLATGRMVRILSVVDAYTRECLALEADTSLGSAIRLRFQQLRTGRPGRLHDRAQPGYRRRHALLVAQRQRAHELPGRRILHVAGHVGPSRKIPNPADPGVRGNRLSFLIPFPHSPAGEWEKSHLRRTRGGHVRPIDDSAALRAAVLVPVSLGVQRQFRSADAGDADPVPLRRTRTPARRFRSPSRSSFCPRFRSRRSAAKSPTPTTRPWSRAG